MEKLTQYPNIIPALGFRIITCYIEDEKAVFDESPLVGWLQITDGSNCGCDAVDPIFLDHGSVLLGSEAYGLQTAYRLLHSGESVTDDLKDQLTKSARAMAETEKKRRARVAQVK